MSEQYRNMTEEQKKRKQCLSNLNKNRRNNYNKKYGKGSFNGRDANHVKIADKLISENNKNKSTIDAYTSTAISHSTAPSCNNNNNNNNNNNDNDNDNNIPTRNINIPTRNIINVNYLISRMKPDNEKKQTPDKIKLYQTNRRSQLKSVYNCNESKAPIPDEVNVDYFNDYKKVIDCITNLKTQKTGQPIKKKQIYYGALLVLYQELKNIRPLTDMEKEAFIKYSHMNNYEAAKGYLQHKNLVGKDFNWLMNNNMISKKKGVEIKEWVEYGKLLDLYIESADKRKDTITDMIQAMFIFLPVARHDYRFLKIVDNEKDINFDDNYLVYKNSRPYKIVLQDSKTDHNFKRTEYLLSDYVEVIDPIYDYVRENKLKSGDYLFDGKYRKPKEQAFSKLVKDSFNKLTGKDVSIGTLRKIWITDNYKNPVAHTRGLEEMIEDILAQQHSAKTEFDTYIRY